jgi:hypothetical protein
MATYTPPGWPAGVHPPGSDDFESTAVGWLLDVVPPDYRLHGVLRRYPVALATMARHHSNACVEGARQGYRTARTELADALPPHAVDTVLAAYRKEGARLAATARAVGLVERALRGEVFTPKTDPANITPAKAAPSKAGPAKAGPAKAGPAKAGPAKAGPAKAASSNLAGAQREIYAIVGGTTLSVCETMAPGHRGRAARCAGSKREVSQCRGRPGSFWSTTGPRTWSRWTPSCPR